MPNILACPPQPLGTTSTNLSASCLLSTFGSDGAGRRMEAALTCLAAAHDAGMQYVHTPFYTLQHLVSPSRANAFLGLDLLRHCWPRAEVAKAAPRCGKCAPAALKEPTPFQLSSKYIIEDTTKQCDGESRSKSFLAEASRSLCPRDGRTLHYAYTCLDYFWCSTVKARQARAWYEVLPSLRAAYLAASEQLLAPSRSLAGGSKLLALGAEARDRDDVVVVGIHHRSVKRRRLSNAVYMRIVHAVRERHAMHIRANPASRLKLHFVVHSDTRLSAAVRNGTGPAGMLPTLGRAADVTLLTPDDATDPLAAMHQLAQCDLLIPSESSFSMVPGLLGNMTLLLPTCFSRAPLPHWLSIPCTSAEEAKAAAVIASLPWPPRAVRS